MNALTAPMALAESGLPVFPVLETKAPACPGGHTAAAVDCARVQELWRRYPGRLVGVPTGAASGIDALDLDLTKHPAAKRWWEENRDGIPATRIHGTRSGGLHLLFRHAVGLRCSAARVGPGIDVRAEGGFIVWWPAAGLPVPLDASPSAWPDWLLTSLTTPRPTVRAPEMPPPMFHDSKGRRYAVGRLREGVERVATAPVGCRNHTLNAATYGLARFVAAGYLDMTELADAMAAAAIAAGLCPSETTRTLASALRAGGVA